MRWVGRKYLILCMISPGGDFVDDDVDVDVDVDETC